MQNMHAQKFATKIWKKKVTARTASKFAKKMQIDKFAKNDQK